MIKLKKILQSKYIIFITVLIAVILSILGYIKPLPIMNDNLTGTIRNIQIKANKVTFELPHYLVNYYVDTIEELDYIKNNYQLGDIINIIGKASIPKDNTNFNLFNYRLYLRSKKIYYLNKANKIKVISKNQNVLYKIKNHIIKKIDKSSNSDYLYAFVLGKTNRIDEEVVESYQINGVSHLFAISGMHVSLLSGVVLTILNKIKKSDFNYIVTILFLLFYSFLASFSPSVLRASFLFVFLFINKKLNFNLKTSNIFVLITSLFLIYNPYYIYNVGFLFSFAISFFLIIYGSISNNFKNYFIKLLITSFISFIASIPISINNFYSLNLLSPLLNLLFVPLVSFIIFPLSLLTFIFNFLNPILNFFVELLESLSLLTKNINLSILLCHIPWYIVIIYYIINIFILEMIKRKKYQYICVIYLVLIIHTNIINLYDEIHMLDIGQGDSILIRLKYNQGTILIDTGGITSYVKEDWKKNNYSLAKNITIPYLKSIGVHKIDYLVITHGDWDHIGEAEYLINNYKIKNVFMNSLNNNNSENNLIKLLNNKNIPYQQVSKYEFNIKNNTFKFINKKGNSENNDSLILFTKINNKNILFMGDADKDNEKYLLEEYNLPKMDILKVGHHGSKNSSDVHFLGKIKPVYALISAGLNNKFGHPNKETLDSLDFLSIPYYVTSINGMIKVILKDEINIYTCQD